MRVKLLTLTDALKLEYAKPKRHTVSSTDGRYCSVNVVCMSSVLIGCFASISAVSTAHEDGVLRLAIEGNIAAGKSTFLQILAKELNFLVVPEPLSKWQSVNADTESFSFSQKSGGNLLEMFYSDAKRWAYTFQSYAFLSRYASTILVCGTSTQYRMRAQLRPFEDFEVRWPSACARQLNPLNRVPVQEREQSGPMNL